LGYNGNIAPSPLFNNHISNIVPSNRVTSNRVTSNRVPPINKKRKINHREKKSVKKRKLNRTSFVSRSLPKKVQETFSVDYSHLVIDTNCFLDHLSNILRLKRYKSLLTVVIPYTVVEELDGLKKDNGGVGQKARAALNSINHEITLGEGWMIGQSLEDTFSMQGLKTNDDIILDCAIFMDRKKLNSENRVILVTRDNGLQIKAKLNHLRSMSMQELMDVLPLFNNSDKIFPLHRIVYKPKNSIQPVKDDNFYNKNQNNDLTLFKLPENIQLEIFSCLNISQILRLSCLCRTFYEYLLCIDNEQQLFWRSLIRKRFNDKNDVLVPKTMNPKQWYMNWTKTCTPIMITR